MREAKNLAEAVSLFSWKGVKDAMLQLDDLFPSSAPIRPIISKMEAIRLLALITEREGKFPYVAKAENSDSVYIRSNG